MKTYLKILRTNWINILGIFSAVYLFGIATTLVEPNNRFMDSVHKALLGGFFGIIFYGMVFWIGFIVMISILDFALMRKQWKNLNLVLFLEWFIISVPFIYWLVIYSEWVFLVAVLTFLITQYLRKEKILKVFSEHKE